jgi:alanyl aminopeptidase
VLDQYASLMKRLPDDAEGLQADALSAADLLHARMQKGEAGGELEATLVDFEARVLKRDDARALVGGEMDKWLANPKAETKLSSDLYATGLSVVLDEGGDVAYDRVLKAYHDIDDPAFAQSVAQALGSVTDPQQAARTRALIASAELGPRETYMMAMLQMSAPETRADMWAALQADFPAFLKAIPTQWQRNTPRLAQYFCDAEGLDALNTLFADYGDLAEGHERALTQTRETIHLCMAQKVATQADLEAAFASVP